MPYVIPGRSIDPSLIRSLLLGPFCEAYARTIKSDLSKQRDFPFGVVLDGWMAAVASFYCLEQSGGTILRGDRIILGLLRKQILTEEIVCCRLFNLTLPWIRRTDLACFNLQGLETMVGPPHTPTGSVERRQAGERVTIESWWDKLCYTKVCFSILTHRECY